MEKFIEKPNITLYPGITVHKDTTLEYNNENVNQNLKDLVFHSVTRIKGENYESTYDTTINLKDGDVLIYEDEGRGYIKPVADFVKIENAIEELECIKE